MKTNDFKICNYLLNKGIDNFPTTEEGKLEVLKEMFTERKETFDSEFSDFLIKNNIDEIPTTKSDKLRVLFNIIDSFEVNIDVLDIKHDNNPTEISVEDFVSYLRAAELNIMEARYFVIGTKLFYKEEKRLKRKENYQKIKSILKK